MSYPWASVGASFLFKRDEQPIFGTDLGWLRDPSYNRARPLGTAIDSIVTLAIGSSVRQFECYLSPTRYTQLEALQNTADSFTDWDRPTPNSQQAFLARISALDRDVVVTCSDGSTQKRIRTLVELVSQ